MHDHRGAPCGSMAMQDGDVRSGGDSRGPERSAFLTTALTGLVLTEGPGGTLSFDESGRGSCPGVPRFAVGPSDVVAARCTLDVSVGCRPYVGRRGSRVTPRATSHEYACASRVVCAVSPPRPRRRRSPVGSREHEPPLEPRRGQLGPARTLKSSPPAAMADKSRNTIGAAPARSGKRSAECAGITV